MGDVEECQCVCGGGGGSCILYWGCRGGVSVCVCGGGLVWGCRGVSVCVWVVLYGGCRRVSMCVCVCGGGLVWGV